ncbi:MAG: response regulator [Pirellulaceae bacterium]
MSHRLLIVDDHPIVRRGLRELVADEPDLEVCGEADDVASALEQLENVRPDVVVVDLSLKRGHGLELIKAIKAQGKRLKILVSSMHDESLYAEHAIRCGASGYINKQEPPDEIINAIRQVLRGEIYLNDKVADLLLRRLSNGHSIGEDPVETLTNRELEVFEMIGRGLSVKQIAGRLGLSQKTIEAHRDRIRIKLTLNNSLEVARRAMQWTLEGH